MNPRDEQNFDNIAVLENIVEAQLIEPVLIKQNIPYRIRSYHDTAYDGLFQFQMGWGAVFAPPEYKQRIIEILNDIRS